MIYSIKVTQETDRLVTVHSSECSQQYKATALYRCPNCNRLLTLVFPRSVGDRILSPQGSSRQDVRLPSGLSKLIWQQYVIFRYSSHGWPLYTNSFTVMSKATCPYDHFVFASRDAAKRIVAWSFLKKELFYLPNYDIKFTDQRQFAIEKVRLPLASKLADEMIEKCFLKAGEKVEDLILEVLPTPSTFPLRGYLFDSQKWRQTLSPQLLEKLSDLAESWMKDEENETE